MVAVFGHLRSCQAEGGVDFFLQKGKIRAIGEICFPANGRKHCFTARLTCSGSD